MAEATFDPHQGPLVVLQVQNHRAVLQRTRLDDHVELLVHEPRLALRDDLDANLVPRVEQPVATTRKQAIELPIAEVQTDFVAADIDVLENWSVHGSLPFVLAVRTTDNIDGWFVHLI